ncbi:PUA and Translation initiation factor SUI1 domain containing protein [Aphelenchoides besseyi]|nr:PUA and Translation initiation factor SUI1 domain containing protein [Aphelenchoides besseyi]
MFEADCRSRATLLFLNVIRQERPHLHLKFMDYFWKQIFLENKSVALTNHFLEAAREMEVPYSTISKFILRIENRENILELLGRSEQLAEEKLKETFLWSLKTNVDSITLPIDVGQFYASFVLKKLPPGVRIDLKKTSYKKFTNFLKAMSEEHQLIKIINFKHELVSSANPIEGGTEEADETTKKTTAPRVSECYSITAAVLPVFLGRRKGDVLQMNDVRDSVLAYAQSKKLINEQKRVELDDTLQMVIRHFLPDRVPLNELVQKLVPLMTKCWTIKLNDGRTNVRKIKMPTIVISVHFIGEELQNEYGIQKKYIKGLELAIKPKKSKR